jgi:hypothetical protein
MSEVKYDRQQINAEIISAQAETIVTKKDGGTYNGAEIIFKAFGEVKSIGIHEKAFGFKPELKSQIESLSQGQKATINRYRKQGDKFWNVDSIVDGHVQKQAPVSGNAAKNFSGSVNPAAIGQAINLGIDAGLSLDDLLDHAKAKAIWDKLEAVKKVMNDVAEGKFPDTPSTPATPPSDDIPF